MSCVRRCWQRRMDACGLHRKAQGELMRDVATPDVDPQSLSMGDRELLRLLSEERSTEEIAENISLGPDEVEERLENLLQRLGLAGRAQAVLYATRQGLVPAELRPYLV